MGPFKTARSTSNTQRQLDFVGSPYFNSIGAAEVPYSREWLAHTVGRWRNDRAYAARDSIDSAVFSATVSFMTQLGARWCNLPLTTVMISSPGEVYRGMKSSFSTDTAPVRLHWFDQGEIFLSESSQFYLEMHLLAPNVDHVFSIYNSFRKEPADAFHLSEFQHIEYEGKISQEVNEETLERFIKHLVASVASECGDDIRIFVDEGWLAYLEGEFISQAFTKIEFTDACNMLAKDTGDESYRTFTLENWGRWEEVRITELMGGAVVLQKMPLLEVPFYHSAFEGREGLGLANNADFILPGYCEVAGSGQRIMDSSQILAKARLFNLPEEDYRPYLDMRSLEGFQTTSGFGLGWQRFIQWLLQLPSIGYATNLPRGHFRPIP